MSNIPIVEIVSGEVFLQDKIVNKDNCYICKKPINKYKNEDEVLLRIGKGIMGFCCTHHIGVMREFLRQFNTLPNGWTKYDKKDVNINNS